MQFVRTVINSKRLEHIVHMPSELRNRNVEILVLPILEKQPKKKKDFNPEEFEGILKMDEDTLAAELDLMRNEWERF